MEGAMDVEEGASASDASEPIITLGEGANFDLPSYISNYTGDTKVRRLLFIAKRCPELQGEALPAAVEELKRGENTKGYQQLYETHKEKLTSLGLAFDSAWVSNTDRQAGVVQGKLENQLSQAQKSGASKEATRLGHTNMGDFWFAQGDVPAALKCYTRARDYCSSPELTRKWCLDVIKCHLALEQYHSIASYVAKAENQERAEQRGPVESSKLKVCSALAHMHSRGNSKDHKNFRFAAKAFLAVSPELGDNYSSVVAPQDLAIYGGLCALATLERAELTSTVVKNPMFKQLLEKAPDMGEIVADFMNSRYAPMLKRMRQLQTSLQLDLHLAKHVDTLFGLIRNRAMVQYFIPYSAVNLHQMAEAFDRDVGSLEKELAQLISDGLISARIDSHNKVLKSRSVNIRSSTFKSALDGGERVAREQDNMLLRASMLRHHLVVAAPKKEGGKSRGAGGAETEPVQTGP